MATPQLLEGAAEVFGAELPRGGRVSAQGAALAVSTWSGCKLLVEGSPDFVCVCAPRAAVQTQCSAVQSAEFSQHIQAQRCFA
jgi:N-terminal beta-sandwich domain of polyadenylation factor